MLRYYPAYYLNKFRGRPAPDPLPPGSTGMLVVAGLFASVHIYGRVMDAVRSRGTPASGLDFGWNTWGTIGARVASLRTAVEAHAATGGRVVLVAHSMGALVCARYLLERPAGVAGFVSVCGVLGGIRNWTLLGWPLFPVVREMKRATRPDLAPELRNLLCDPPVPMTFFQADKDEFVRDQSRVGTVVRFRTCVSHSGPVLEPGGVAAIAERVCAYACAAQPALTSPP